jgi:hypothetical protein
MSTNGADLVEALRRAAERGEDLRPRIAACFDAAESADVTRKNAMLEALDAVIREQPSERAGSLGLLAGAILEVGGDPRAFPPAVFDHLLDLLGRIQGPEDETELPDAYYELERGAMACLSRSPELRRVLPQKPALLERMVRYSEHYGFLGKMLRVLDDEPLLVLHPSTGRGFRFVISAIADNFELHALLRAALAGRGEEKIESAFPATVASGESATSDWQLANWFALRPGGEIDTKEFGKSWIWNEGVPADIAPFEGTRVVLIGKSTIQRGWRAGRVFSAMTGRLEPRGKLARSEAEDLLAQMIQ